MTAIAGPPVIHRSNWDRIKWFIIPVVPFLLLLGVWLSVIAIYNPAIGVLPRPLKVLEVPFNEEEYWPNVRASVFWMRKVTTRVADYTGAGGVPHPSNLPLQRGGVTGAQVRPTPIQ